MEQSLPFSSQKRHLRVKGMDQNKSISEVRERTKAFLDRHNSKLQNTNMASLLTSVQGIHGNMTFRIVFQGEREVSKDKGRSNTIKTKPPLKSSKNNPCYNHQQMHSGRHRNELFKAMRSARPANENPNPRLFSFAKVGIQEGASSRKANKANQARRSDTVEHPVMDSHRQ